MSASRRIALLPSTTLAAAVTGIAGTVADTYRLAGVLALAIQVKFVRAGGGTSCNVWIQTTLDGGVTWIDIACAAFLTTTATKVFAVTSLIAPGTQALVPTDGTLTDDTVVNGVLGDQFRTKLTTVGTYTGASSITVDVVAKGA